jgi:very-short-patch-repair endonuclease
MTRRDASIDARHCPECGADPGYPCIGKRGARRSVHRGRLTGAYAAGAAVRARKVFEAPLHLVPAAFMARCESPIERMLLAMMFDTQRHFPDGIEISNAPIALDALPPPLGNGVRIFLQAKVGPYRADFLFDWNKGPRRRLLVVELDGHDFHEKTKEQALRDKQRDRYFVMQGLELLRFAGSEVYADADQVGAEIWTHLHKGGPR